MTILNTNIPYYEPIYIVNTEDDTMVFLDKNQAKEYVAITGLSFYKGKLWSEQNAVGIECST
jgi:hypothetical protein